VWQWLETHSLIYLAVLAFAFLVFLAIRAAVHDSYLRSRFRLAVWLLAAAVISELARLLFAEGEPWKLSVILASWACVVVVVLLLFKLFRRRKTAETKAPDKKPADRHATILQDAAMVGACVLVATMLAPEKPLFATSAIGGLVLGLALQDTLGNLFAGLAIQIEKPFEVGHWVKVADHEGRVTEVTWRGTKIHTRSGTDVTIPNSLVSKGVVVNFTTSRPVRYEFGVGLEYHVPPNRARRLLLGTLESLPGISDKKTPDVLLSQYGESAIQYRCRFWIDNAEDSERLIDQFSRLLHYRLRRAGLRVPFPIRNLQISRPRRKPLDVEPRLRFLERTWLFRSLASDELRLDATALKPAVFADQEEIIRQGDEGDSMFFIRRGQVRIHRDAQLLKTLDAGEFFGEMALLTGEPRSASVTAEGDVETYVLSKQPFRQVLLRNERIAEEISRTVAERKKDWSKSAAASRKEGEQTEDTAEGLLNRIRKFFKLR
jgi:small-conductance mechanosensitive channel